MNLRNIFLIVLAVFGFSAGSYAQIDRVGKTNSVEGLGKPLNNSTLSTPGNLSNKKSGLFERRKNPMTLSPEKEKTFSMTEENGLKEYKLEGFVPKAFKDKEIKDEYRKDAYLGDVKTGGTYVELYFRDHEYVDGDRVRVYVNGEMVVTNVSLGASYHPVLVKLKSGFNTIEFEALNMGTSGPNTAELVVYDDNGAVLTENEWNLTTGMKASLIVVKQ